MCNLPEGVDLAEPLLVGQGGDVVAEALEGVVDALHPLALAHVGRVPLLDLKLFQLGFSGSPKCRLCIDSSSCRVSTYKILGASKCFVNSIIVTL